MRSLETQSCGYVSTVHGVKGQLKVVLEQSIKLQEGTWCFLEFQKKPVPFFMEECWVNDDTAVLKLKGIDTPEQAAELRNKAFMLPVEQLGDLAQEDTSDSFLGFTVWLVNGIELGEVKDVFDNSGQILLDVKRGEESYLVPFHEDWLESLDPEEKKLLLEVPEGLLDL